MKKYKIQIRSQKNSQSCVPLNGLDIYLVTQSHYRRGCALVQYNITIEKVQLVGKEKDDRNPYSLLSL